MISYVITFISIISELLVNIFMRQASLSNEIAFLGSSW